MQTFEQFKRAKFFPTIDGLRAISVILVITFHAAEPAFQGINGYLGVTIFFVISGFLITTLLLREEENTGRINIRNFYIRRIFRIFPLYYLALGTYSFLVIGLNLGSDPAQFLQRLPLLATYNGEFAGSGTFSHSWSLGIEEKFYLFWPALGFAAPITVRKRLVLTTALLTVSVATDNLDGWRYFAIYTPILAGCLLAVVMNNERGFIQVKKIIQPVCSIPIFALTAYLFIVNNEEGYQHVAFSIAATLLFPTLICGPAWVRTLLSLTPLRWIGTLAYGAYLFHPLVMALADKLIQPNGSLIEQIARTLLILGTTVAFAAALNKTFEKPFIHLGARLIRRRTNKHALDSD